MMNPTTMKAPWPLVVALLVLAAAIIYHAAVTRYTVTHLNAAVIVRTDRLTGRSEMCVFTYRSEPMTCRPAERWIAPPDSTQRTAP